MERECLQDTLAQALQAQQSLDQNDCNQHEREKREQESRKVEVRRQKRREQGRQEEEKRCRSAELVTKRHTQTDVECLLTGGARDKGAPHSREQRPPKAYLCTTLVRVNQGLRKGASSATRSFGEKW